MLPNKKLQEILQKNAEFEKETPYNFCDSWCQHCAHETQVRCKIYQDEFEQKITCITHGRETNDPEITEWVREKQFEAIGEVLQEHEEELEIDFDEIDDPAFEKIKEHIRFVENNPLDATAKQYHKKCRAFLENIYFKKKGIMPEPAYDFEVVNWHHTLLPAKLNRALAGFHEPACEGDLSLYDAIAQLEICKKAIKESINALRKIDPNLPYYHLEILELLALLHNIHSRIEVMESSI